MRIFTTFTILSLAAASLLGCTTASGGLTGALAGGLTGAGIGAIAGDATAGALLGTGVGLALGSAVGGANQDIAHREGWVYDDAWGSRGHYEYPAYRPAVVTYDPQPVAYEPVYEPVYEPEYTTVYAPAGPPPYESYHFDYHGSW